MRSLWDTILRTGSDLETDSHPGRRQGPGKGGWGGRDSAESVHSRGMGSEAEGSLHCEEVRRGGLLWDSELAVAAAEAWLSIWGVK